MKQMQYFTPYNLSDLQDNEEQAGQANRRPKGLGHLSAGVR